MSVNAEVNKNPNEANINLIRRFSKRLQGSRALNKARGVRFFSRTSSKLKKKERALKKITRWQEVEKLKKLGRYKPKNPRRR